MHPSASPEPPATNQPQASRPRGRSNRDAIALVGTAAAIWLGIALLNDNRTAYQLAIMCGPILLGIYLYRRGVAADERRDKDMKR
jgi:hypothetical protein